MTRTVAVMGANGQLGQALVETFDRAPGWRARPLLHRDLDVADAEGVTRVLDGADDVFINTAYWATEETEMALRVNALGPRLLAERCAALGTLLVQISTDYVFDGEASEPYRETDRAEPRSVYGISKLAGELLVRGVAAEHLIVRVSSLYDRGGSRAKGGTNFVTDLLAMYDAGRPLRVVTDQFHSPTYAPDAAETIRQLVERAARGTFHVSNAGSCSKYEFAAAIFRLAGLDARIEPITLADLPAHPPRPRYTVLAHEGLRLAGIEAPRPWEEGLAAYLAELGRLHEEPVRARR